MSIVIFLIILSALVIVHELGHFFVARFFGIRVDEFGLGFPPRAKTLFSWKGTPFTLNWLPFGGFVKIFGENPEPEQSSVQGESRVIESDSFQSKNRAIQSAVLVAGVAGNFFFAWVLISIGFMIGLPTSSGLSLPISDPRIVVTSSIADSPADLAGLISGDEIVTVNGEAVSTPEEVSEIISNSRDPVVFEIKREEEIYTKVIKPEEGIVSDRLAIGVSMDVVGIAKLPLHQAVWHGLETTSELTVMIAVSVVTFIFQALGGSADFSSVTGPVGIVGLVGDATALGFIYLLTFTALISINLSIINLLPFPALDGGRLLFVIIESITRRRVPPRVFNLVNTAGFALLILLMVLITFHDIRNIF